MPKAPPRLKQKGSGKRAAPRVKEKRTSSSKRGYGRAWQKAREGFLAKHPLCAECNKKGSVSAATVVDHITPHKNDMKLFWERKNWQPLCAPCHSRKTAREDGGFGNRQESNT